MRSRFLNKLKENLGLKLLSILIAVVIWYVVVDINDPVETQSYSVKITVENDSYISNGKQVYHIDDSYKTVTVYLKGNRSVLKEVSAEDITVTADLTQIVDMDTDPVMVPLSASCPGISASNITLSRQAIPITIETVDSREFPVTVDVGDSEPGTNFEVGETTPNPEKVVITGAASIVDSIDTVVAKIDVTGMEDFVYNLSKYDDIAELYLISDILITDYSSVFFDYANLKRPMLFFTYDLDKYRDVLRGFYIDMEKDIPGPLVFTTDEIIDSVKNIEAVSEKYADVYDTFYERFCGWEDGHASENCIKEVFK